MFGGPVQGSWSIYSKKDPRWNISGRAMVGNFIMPREVEEALDQKKRELGEEPPDDLEWLYMKD